MQYQRLGVSHLGRALLGQGFAEAPTSTHNIACKPLPYVVASLGLLPPLSVGLLDDPPAAVQQINPVVSHLGPHAMSGCKAGACRPWTAEAATQAGECALRDT